MVKGEEPGEFALRLTSMIIKPAKPGGFTPEGN